MRRVILPQDTRTFQRVTEGGTQLSRTGKLVPAGVNLVVSEPMTMVYDHREQLAVYFRDAGEEFLLIVSEMEVAGFVQ